MEINQDTSARPGFVIELDLEGLEPFADELDAEEAASWDEFPPDEFWQDR